MLKSCKQKIPLYSLQQDSVLHLYNIISLFYTDFQLRIVRVIPELADFRICSKSRCYKSWLAPEKQAFLTNWLSFLIIPYEIDDIISIDILSNST